MERLILEQKSKLDEQVKITCYGAVEKTSRREALEKYFDYMRCSDGAEHERYENVFFHLLMGKTNCCDTVSFKLPY